MLKLNILFYFKREHFILRENLKFQKGQRKDKIYNVTFLQIMIIKNITNNNQRLLPLFMPSTFSVYFNVFEIMAHILLLSIKNSDMFIVSR